MNALNPDSVLFVYRDWIYIWKAKYKKKKNPLIGLQGSVHTQIGEYKFIHSLLNWSSCLYIKDELWSWAFPTNLGGFFQWTGWKLLNKYNIILDSFTSPQGSQSMICIPVISCYSSHASLPLSPFPFKNLWINS